MKATEFKQMIRNIVAEELKLQLPIVIERVITEKYLRKIVAESNFNTKPLNNNKKASLREILSDNEEEEGYEEKIPKPMSNKHNGVYDYGSPMIQDESKNKIFSDKTHPLHNLKEAFEGTKRISNIGQPGVQTNVNIDKHFDVERIRKLSGVVVNKPQQQHIVNNQRELELQKYRQSLDVKPNIQQPLVEKEEISQEHRERAARIAAKLMPATNNNFDENRLDDEYFSKMGY